MAIIKISDLKPVGHDLFSDSDSYLLEMNPDESLSLRGGWTYIAFSAAVITFNAYKGYRAGRGY